MSCSDVICYAQFVLCDQNAAADKEKRKVTDFKGVTGSGFLNEKIASYFSAIKCFNYNKNSFFFTLLIKKSKVDFMLKCLFFSYQSITLLQIHHNSKVAIMSESATKP